MATKVSKPLLIVAAVLSLVVVILDVASLAFIGGGAGTSGQLDQVKQEHGLDDVDVRPAEGDGPPGYAIPTMAFVDGLLLFNILLMILSLLAPAQAVGRTQGIVTLVLSILALIGDIVVIVMAFVMLLLMVGLLLAFPFGTLAYLALFGSFPQGAAVAVSGVAFFVKLIFGICLVIAHPMFIQNKGLVLMFLTSLLLTFVVSLLHGIVPGFLVSITDALGAIVVGIVAAVWLIVHLVGSIISIVKAAA